VNCPTNGRYGFGVRTNISRVDSFIQKFYYNISYWSNWKKKSVVSTFILYRFLPRILVRTKNFVGIRSLTNAREETESPTRWCTRRFIRIFFLINISTRADREQTEKYNNNVILFCNHHKIVCTISLESWKPIDEQFILFFTPILLCFMLNRLVELLKELIPNTVYSGLLEERCLQAVHLYWVNTDVSGNQKEIYLSW
jgi:hypothetical protein